LTRYHTIFAERMPPRVPSIALRYFSNPLMLVQIRPQLETAFGRVPGGSALLQRLFVNVKVALESGLPLIFVCSAVIMSLAILLHAVLRTEPLRTRAAPEAEFAAH